MFTPACVLRRLVRRSDATTLRRYDAINRTASLNAVKAFTTLPLILFASDANAQLTIQGNINYYTSTSTINTDVRGRDIVVGKLPGGTFANAEGDTDILTPYTVTVASPAQTTFNNVSDGYGGINLFNNTALSVTGGSVNFAVGYNNSNLRIGGGTVSTASVDNTAQMNINNGRAGQVQGYDTSTINVTGGTVGGLLAGDGIDAYGASTVNISGGTVNRAQTSLLNSTINISGGTVFNTAGNVSITGGAVSFVSNDTPSASTVSITGGVVTTAFAAYTGIFNVRGGTVTTIYGNDNSTVNLVGGRIGGVDTNLTDGNRIGIYQTGNSTLNIFGAGFQLASPVAGSYGGVQGNYSLLTGILLDGTDLITTIFRPNNFFFGIGAGGGTQSEPIKPGQIHNGSFFFGNTPSGAWFDPPLVGSYDFAMTDGNFFTSILDFPSNIGDADGKFTVAVGNSILGQFSAGQSVNFSNYGFFNGVSAFTISGISPTVDGANPNAFPIKLGFSSPFASFSMTGVASAAPEPGTLALLVPGLAMGTAGIVRRRRLRQK